MAEKAVRETAPFDVVLPEDKKLPAEKQTTFKFRGLTQAERMRAMDNVEAVQVERSGDRQIRFRSFQQSLELVLATLLSVENFPVGAPEKYPVTGTFEERAQYVDMLRDTDVVYLGDYVFDRSTLGPPEKNS